MTVQRLRPVVLVRYGVASAYPPYRNSGCTSTTALYPVMEASCTGCPVAFGRDRPSVDGCPKHYPWHLATMAVLSPCGSGRTVHLGDPVITRIRRCDVHRCLVHPFDLTDGEQSVSAGKGICPFKVPYISAGSSNADYHTVRRFKHRYVVVKDQTLGTEV